MDCEAACWGRAGRFLAGEWIAAIEGTCGASVMRRVDAAVDTPAVVGRLLADGRGPGHAESLLTGSVAVAVLALQRWTSCRAGCGGAIWPWPRCRGCRVGHARAAASRLAQDRVGESASSVRQPRARSAELLLAAVLAVCSLRGPTADHGLQGRDRARGLLGRPSIGRSRGWPCDPQAGTRPRIEPVGRS